MERGPQCVRVRVVIEVNTERTRESFNAAAMAAARDLVRHGGTLVYCATEVVDRQELEA